MFSYCTFCKLTLRTSIKDCCRYQKQSAMEIKLKNVDEHYHLLSTTSISSPITNFYRGKSVFVTGGTGFTGLVLVEKLLFECSDIKNIFMLIRPKHGKSVEQRLLKYLDSPAFQRVKERNPETIKKVIPIIGNLTEREGGLSPEDIKRIQKEVSIVFHVAADVRFNSSLKDAVKNNTLSTVEVIALCKKISALTAFVYVSTAYCNSNNALIEERVYNLYKNNESSDYYYVVNNFDDSSDLRGNLLQGRPNTYTYAKAMTEELISCEIQELPAVIVRPSVIIASMRDPAPGWVEGWNGINNVIVAMGKGLLRCWYGHVNYVADLIPVDVVCNLCIAAAWDTHNKRAEGSKELKVYNCCSGLQNPITVGKFMTTCLYYTRKHIFKDVLYTPTIIITRYRFLHQMLVFFLQYLPYCIIDGLAWIFRRKPKMLKIQKKLTVLVSVLEYFTLNQFIFVDGNVRNLYEKMSETDRVLFDFNVKNINWDNYLENYVMGLKKYLDS